MLWLFLAMLLTLVLAGVVAVYVAYPHRGQDVPHAPWLGDALRKGVESLPTLDNQLGPAGAEAPSDDRSRDQVDAGRGR